MKTKEVTIAVMLIVALVATMGFVSAVSSSGNAPEQISVNRESGVTSPSHGFATHTNSVTGEAGTRGGGTRADYNVDGGWLRVDDDEGTVCTGNAQGWDLWYVQPGATCKVSVDWTYVDDPGLSGSWVKFRLTVPDDEDEKRIFDWLGSDQSDDGTLQKTFTINPNQHYTFTIYCEHGDNNFEDTASINTHSGGP